MENILLKLLSFVLSILMFLFNTVSSVFPGIFPIDPIENTYEICAVEQFNLTENKEKAVIISDYISWYSLADRESDIFEKYGWEYFFTGSLAVITLVLPDPLHEVEIISVNENGDTLEVDYKISRSDGEAADVLETKVIVIQTNKNVSLIDLNKIEDAEKPQNPEIPEEPSEPNLPEFEGFPYQICESDNFDDYFYNKSCDVIQNYDKWNSYYVGSDPDLDKYDEEFFADKNLVIVHIEIPADGKLIEIISIEQSASYNKIYLDFRVKNGESSYNKGFWSVVIETDKSITSIHSFEIGIKGDTKLIDAEYFKQREIGIGKEDGAYKIITSSKEYSALLTEDYIFSSEFSFSNEYFKDSNLALIYVMIPNINGYYGFDVSVLSKEENGNTLNIEYSTVLEETEEEDKGEAVKYFVMLVEISKNITEINAVEKSFKNIYKTFDIILNFSGATENPQLVSDYETWSKICTSDLPYFDKYDEEYFENYSVVLLYETMPDSGSFFDVIKVKENEDTFELVYNIDSYGGTQALEHKVLVVEVSKDIEKVSAQRKEIDYAYSQGGNFKLEADSAILISDYSQWQTHSASTNSNYSKYDEAYFEDHSLVVVKSANASSDVISIMRYLYKEDGVLNVGINKHIYYNAGGFAAFWYQTFVIEVDKDVTEVNLEMFY